MSIKYIVLSGDGAVVNSGTMNYESFDFMCSHTPEYNHVILDEIPNDVSLYYWDGTQLVSKGESPSTSYQFSYESKSWVYALDLESAKEKRWSEIKSDRSLAEYSGFTYQDKVYDSDEISQSRIAGAVSLAMLADDSFSIDWTVADNSVVTLSRVQMIGLGISLGQHVALQHEKGRASRVLIENATTIEEVVAVSF